MKRRPHIHTKNTKRLLKTSMMIIPWTSSTPIWDELPSSASVATLRGERLVRAGRSAGDIERVPRAKALEVVFTGPVLWTSKDWQPNPT